MKNDMREQIDKVKNYGQFLNEDLNKNLSYKIKIYERIKSEVTTLLLNEIERIGRIELNNDENLDEFIMGMGSYFFTTHKNGTNIKGNTTTNYKSKEIDNIINKYDSEFNLTGEGMRFSKNSKVITDW